MSAQLDQHGLGPFERGTEHVSLGALLKALELAKDVLLGFASKARYSAQAVLADRFFQLVQIRDAELLIDLVSFLRPEARNARKRKQAGRNFGTQAL